MNVEFGEKEPVVRMSEEIIIGGEVVGKVKVTENDNTRYHAALERPGNRCNLSVLLQGFGDTKEEAVVDALNKGRDEVRIALQYIEELETKLRD